MSSLIAANVGSSLDFTFARFVDCMMIEIRGNFTAICAGFVGQEEKRSIFTVRGVICAIRKTLGARTGASRKVRDQTVHLHGRYAFFSNSLPGSQMWSFAASDLFPSMFEIKA